MTATIVSGFRTRKVSPPKVGPSLSVLNPEPDYDPVFVEPRGQISSTDSDIQRFGRTCDRRKANSKEKDAIAREALASTQDVCATRIAVHTEKERYETVPFLLLSQRLL